jgi:hypothetical protein
MDHQLQRLVDRNAIVEVSLRYARSLDFNDVEQAALCLHDEIDTDFTDTIGMSPTTVSKQQFLDHIGSVTGMRSLHITTNHIVDFVSDTEAELRAYIYVPHRKTIDDAVSEYLFVGHVEQRYRKFGAEWKLVGLRPRVLWEEGDGRVVDLNRDLVS